MNLEQDPQGKPSLMRWVVKRVYWLAALTVTTGLAGWLVLDRAGAVEIVGAAVGMLTLVVGAKAWQRQAEGK